MRRVGEWDPIGGYDGQEHARRGGFTFTWSRAIGLTRWLKGMSDWVLLALCLIAGTAFMLLAIKLMPLVRR